MANDLTAVLSSLTFEGLDLQRSDLLIHLDIVEGLNDGLDVRGGDTIIPGARGRTPRNRKADVRHVLLAGMIQGVGSTEADRLASWQNARDVLEATFDPEAAPGTLVGMALDGTWRSLEARTVSTVYAPSDVPGVGTISIALDSVDPDWLVTGGGS